MKYPDILEAGRYRVTLTIVGEIEVSDVDGPTSVERALSDTQDLFRSMVDWNIERLDK